ncbi:unnamed protein product [Gongylonema pulchrum]|uniref:Uncharacterized protein n=1 Tax=Gongylonema pulchrum TaxID=637853 RepID=A0A183DWL7_9BILA|nr:unnamed protein product [Gongylonema pulchrum]
MNGNLQFSVSLLSSYGSRLLQSLEAQRDAVPAIPSVASSGVQQFASRRSFPVTFPVSSGSSSQHQIVMTSGGPIDSSAQQSYAVVVTSQENISSGQQQQQQQQQFGGRVQYAVRQEGSIGERQTVYRSATSSAVKARPGTAMSTQRVSFEPYISCFKTILF